VRKAWVACSWKGRSRPSYDYEVSERRLQIRFWVRSISIERLSLSIYKRLPYSKWMTCIIEMRSLKALRNVPLHVCRILNAIHTFRGVLSSGINPFRGKTQALNGSLSSVSAIKEYGPDLWTFSRVIVSVFDRAAVCFLGRDRVCRRFKKLLDFLEGAYDGSALDTLLRRA